MWPTLRASAEAGCALPPATTCAALVQAPAEGTENRKRQAESGSRGAGRGREPGRDSQGSGTGAGDRWPWGPGVRPRLLFVAEEQGRGVSPAAPRPPGHPLPAPAPPTHHLLTRPRGLRPGSQPHGPPPPARQVGARFGVEPAELVRTGNGPPRRTGRVEPLSAHWGVNKRKAGRALSSHTRLGAKSTPVSAHGPHPGGAPRRGGVCPALARAPCGALSRPGAPHGRARD